MADVALVIPFSSKSRRRTRQAWRGRLRGQGRHALSAAHALQTHSALISETARMRAVSKVFMAHFLTSGLTFIAASNAASSSEDPAMALVAPITKGPCKTDSGETVRRDCKPTDF